ncbi:hypothetical protein FQN60_007879 [Etheostoma spectabile]|uniref:Uncharacterized protein n=1 Tax=Etheostoma spectabile TaxID=54343 RepID=A0A5J5D097_9PERO|nr:hypothetical protein FQN60_007879 [Etheostoma spectabile]
MQLYLLLRRVDDGQVSSFALAVRLALGPIPGGPGDEVTAVAEEMPVHGADDRGLQMWSCLPFVVILVASLASSSSFSR